MILLDAGLKRAGSPHRLPVLAVGIGLYLPPTSASRSGSARCWAGGSNARCADARSRTGRAARRADRQRLHCRRKARGRRDGGGDRRHGNQAPLALAGVGFAPTADWITLALFAAVAVWMARRVLRQG
ncbi:MAG: hypothetical protein WDN04_07155 [Rhodospirillales bacterium]